MKRTLLPILAGFLGLTAAHANERHADNRHLWLNYVGDHPLFDSKWGLHLEVQNRREDWGDEWQQLLARPGINYSITPRLSLSMGYAYVRTYPYGEMPAVHEFDEHRVWEQISYKHQGFGLEWSHRLRLEQRWIEELAQVGDTFSRVNWRGENRIRYMLRTAIPLTRDKRTYVALWDELFFNFGGNVARNEFDQNRAFIGLGRKLTDTTRLEVGFLEQTVQKRDGVNWEHNHTLSVWLTSTLPFFPKRSQPVSPK